MTRGITMTIVVVVEFYRGIPGGFRGRCLRRRRWKTTPTQPKTILV
jgi:hypothetical protein